MSLIGDLQPAFFKDKNHITSCCILNQLVCFFVAHEKSECFAKSDKPPISWNIPLFDSCRIFYLLVGAEAVIFDIGVLGIKNL